MNIFSRKIHFAEGQAEENEEEQQQPVTNSLNKLAKATEEQETMDDDEPEKKKQKQLGDDESVSKDRQKSSSKPVKKSASGGDHIGWALNTNGTPSKFKSDEEKDGSKSPSRKSSSALRMPNSERLLDYSDSSDESEDDGPNAIAKFVSAAAANSTIDAGVGNDNELLYCICIPDVGPPTPKNEDYEKTEQNTDSTTTEPQQKTSADGDKETTQLVGSGFSMTAMVEEVETPAGLGSFGPIYGYGNDAVSATGADKPSTTAESHSPPSSSTVDGVEEEDYAGNTSVSISIEKAIEKSMSNNEKKKVAAPKKMAKSLAKSLHTQKKDTQLGSIKSERLTEDGEKQYLIQVWMDANEVADRFPELCKRFNQQKTMKKKISNNATDSDVLTDSDKIERITNNSEKTNPQASKSSPISLSKLSARYRSNRDRKRTETAAEKPSTSVVWTYFNRSSGDSTNGVAKAECLCCKAQGKTTLLSQSNTSYLWTHLEHMHSAEFANASALKRPYIKNRTESAAKKKLTSTKTMKPEASGTRSSPKSASKKVSSQQKESNAAEYKVDGILRERTKNGETEYYVHWEGYDDAENTWEPRKHLAHLNVFNDYIAQKKSGEGSQKKKTGSSHITPKKDVKKYAPKSSNALSSTRAKKVDDDEQSGEDQQKDKEEGEDGDHKETVEMDDSGKERDDEDESGDEEDEYEVEEVLDRRMATTKGKKKEWKYLIKWKGHDEQTWEPHSNVEHLELVKKYIALEDAKAAEGKPEPSTKSRKRNRTATNEGDDDGRSSTSSRATHHYHSTRLGLTLE